MTIRPRILVLTALAIVLAIGGIAAAFAASTPQKRVKASGSHSTPAPTTPAPAIPSTPLSLPSVEPPPPNPSPPQTMTSLRVGADLSTNTFNGTKDETTYFSISVTRAVATSQPPDEYSSAPANGHFVTFTLHAVNAHASSGPVDVNPFDFYVTVAGQHFDQEAGNAYEASNTLDASTLAPNEDSRGTVSFDLPARHGQLVYSPNYNGTPLAYWTF